MRKQLLSIVLATTSILCSCVSTYTNKIFYGKYVRDTEIVNNTTVNCFMNILPISKEEFELSNHVNVLEDASGKRCNQFYKIELYSLDENETRTDVVFEDLKPNSKKSFLPGTMVAYEDKNGLLIRPGAADGLIEIDFLDGSVWCLALEDRSAIRAQVNCNT